jgi:hypothetical protein
VGLTSVCGEQPQAKRCALQLTYTPIHLLTPPSLFLTMASSSSSPELSHPLHTHPPNPYKYSTIEEVLDDLSR